MSIWHCQYCYFYVRKTAVDKWAESYLEKHVDNGKKWVINFMIIWFLPIVLIVVTFFLNFSIYTLIPLIGFIIILAAMVIIMKK